MANLFWTTPWPGLLAWSVLYVSDYYLTITCAQMYQQGVKNVIAFEGSYELTPYFQKDVDALQRVSGRFVIALVLVGLGLVAAWWLAWQLPWQAPFAFLLGALIGMQLAVHVRHVRNRYLFRAVLAGKGVQGRIEYTRPVMLHMSSVEFLALAGAFAICALVTLSPFMLGATFGCLSLALKHRRLSRPAAPVREPT